MRVPSLFSALILVFCVLMAARPACGQVVETVGTRALGMGGAFVAVASDSSAVWWNPAGLAAGPFFDSALTQSRGSTDDALPAWRQRVSGFSAAAPPIGISYYRFRITDIRPFAPTTAEAAASREDRRVGVPVRSLAASQWGVTIVQTLIPGVHAGATLKYVRGALHGAREDGLIPPGDLLDRGEDLDTTESAGGFGADVGVLAVAGPVRLGARVGNALEPEIGGVTLRRQARIGAAFDVEAVSGVPLMIAIDADVKKRPTLVGDRQMVAIGAEQWFFSRRLALRGGGRLNTTGAEERVGSAGASVAIRPGMFVDGHVSRGSAQEAGWSVAARVSF
jgi:hypothetical protein